MLCAASYGFKGRVYAELLRILALLVLLPLGYQAYQLKVQQGFKTAFYPQQMACIDDALEAEGLRNGVAQYWDAKALQAVSRLDLRMAQYSRGLGEMRWMTSASFFRDFYDFAIVAEDQAMPFFISGELPMEYKLSAEQLIAMNGPPKRVVACGNRSVYVYGHDALRVKKFINVGDAYQWKACDLFTQIGQSTAGCELEKKDIAQPGFLSFGPYEVLPSGDYAFDLDYYSPAPTSDTVGAWDVLIAEGAIVINRGVLNGSEGRLTKIAGVFSLDKQHNMATVEIRTFANPEKSFVLKDLRIKKIG